MLNKISIKLTKFILVYADSTFQHTKYCLVNTVCNVTLSLDFLAQAGRSKPAKFAQSCDSNKSIVYHVYHHPSSVITAVIIGT